MIPIIVQSPSSHIKRLCDLLTDAELAAKKARAAYIGTLQANETFVDRAVAAKEMLFDDLLDALLAAWDGEPHELVECVQDRLGIKIPLMGRLVAGEDGRYSIEWFE